MQIKLFNKIISIRIFENRPYPTYELVTRKVKNTYEAAYYLIAGAKVDSIQMRKLPYNTKEAFSTQWIFNMSNIPENFVDKWRLGRSVAKVQDIEIHRAKLKKMVKKSYQNKKWGHNG